MTIKVPRRTVLIYVSCGVVIAFIAVMALIESKVRHAQQVEIINATNTQVSLYFYGLTKTTAALTATPTRMSILTPTPTARR